MHQQRVRARRAQQQLDERQRGRSSNRDQLMRQQFYTNNERSTPPTTIRPEQVGVARNRTTPTADEQPKWRERTPGRQQTETTSAAAAAPPPPTTDRLFSRVGAPSSTTNCPEGLGQSLAQVQAAGQVPRECLQQYNPAYHSASPSMPSGAIGGPSGGLVDFGPGGGLSSNFSSLATGGTAPADASQHPLVVDCDASQLALMNIRTEELNFSDTEEVWLVKAWPEILARVSLVAPIVLLGLIGNLTIIYSMCRFKPIRSKPTNIFILNMALADLLTTIVCPNAALLTDIYQFYVLGSFVCRSEGFMKITCLLVSAYSLIVLSFDWFLSVVKPCRKRITIQQAWLALVSIWLVSILMASPLLHWRRLRERHWRDLTEVWCCELIESSKYYWVFITLFLIYLPTFIMTIVLVVILAQMDRFEAKLRRSRGLTSSSSPATKGRPGPNGSQSGGGNRWALPSSRSFSNNHSALSTTANTHHQHQAAGAGCGPARISSRAAAAAATANQTRTCEPSGTSSLSISMKYRRRIVKILFFYLLTSIVCWTPLQFTIIYRHFRSEAVPARWYFELTFYSQLSASLSAAMNPIIFGFLSQPFRRVVTKSLMFRFLDKVWASKGRSTNRSDPPAGQQHQPAQEHQMQAMQHRPGLRQTSAKPAPNNNNTTNDPSGQRRRSPGREQQLEPRLTIDYVEHPQRPGRQARGPPRHKRVSFNSKTGPSGLENEAYERNGDEGPS